MEPIYIYPGNCTVFGDCTKWLTFHLETDLDLTGWTAEFKLFSITRKITDITSKSFDVILSYKETKELLPGKALGSITLTDNRGNVKTIVNNIPFEITYKVIENEYQEIDLTVPESSGVDIKLKVGSIAVTSVNGMTGDVVIEIPDVSNLATKEEIPDLTNYVKNTDYATTTTGGVIKPSFNYGSSVSTQGYLGGVNMTAEFYSKAGNYILISKGTLENIKDNYVKRGLTENQTELTADEKANAKAWLGYAEPTDIMQAIAAIPQFKLSIVDELPLAGEKMTLYLVPKEGTNNDVYDEYIWIEQTTSFEHLGTTAVDLTDYVSNTDYAQGAVAGVVKTSTYYGVATNAQGFLIAAQRTLDSYNKGDVASFISKGTLENVLTQYSKTVLTTETDYNALETKDANTLYLIEE